MSGTTINADTQLAKPGQDKVEVNGDSVLLTATPGGRAELRLPSINPQDFVAQFRVQVISGQGIYELAFHITPALEQAVAIYPEGKLAILRSQVARPSGAPPGLPNPFLFGPEQKIAADDGKPVAVSVSVLGPDITVSLDGKEAAHVSNRADGGNMAFWAAPDATAKETFVVRLQELSVYNQGATSQRGQ
ncbi:MAG: hypothetical protein ACHQ7M_06825 [Chloroflexota bacterium]